jgi:hypothetical protein
MKRKSIFRVSLIGGISAILVIIFVAIVFGGMYNVAATSKHSKTVEWVLRTTMENSVRNHAKNVKIPDTLNLNDRKFYKQFYGHYAAACVTCHASPDKKADPWMVTLYPSAPDLTKKEVVGRWSDKELYWIIKNGIAESGMIGLGPTHPDEAVWGVTAFVKNLPRMTPQDYKTIAEWYAKDKAERHRKNQ